MNTLSLPTQFEPDIKPGAGVLNSVPAWGSYLYQNFLLPAFSPSDWINNTPSSNMNTNNGNTIPTDYFGNVNINTQSWPGFSVKTEPVEARSNQAQPHQTSHNGNSNSNANNNNNNNNNVNYFTQSIAGPSSYYPAFNNYQNQHPHQSLSHQQPPTSIPTSLLMMSQQSNSSNISPSVDVIDAQMVRSPSPLDTPRHSPGHINGHGTKRRALSLDSDSHDEHDHDHDHEHDHEEVAEGVERDGMIWGMKVEDYRALSARERKRVRNRISARTFRAKRKEHLSLLENDLESKDVQIKLAKDEAARLRAEVANLKKRLSKYEGI